MKRICSTAWTIRSFQCDSIHLNFGFTRSWFQTPNTFDSQIATPWNGVVVSNGGLDPNGNVVGPADQRSQIKTFNIAPSWTRLLSSTAVFTLGAFVRRDQFNYYPSGNPFADLGPINLQRETVGQNRTLTNAGLRSDLSYVKGIHNLKVGAVYEQTFLDEQDTLGIVDPTFLPSLTDSNGSPLLQRQQRIRPSIHRAPILLPLRSDAREEDACIPSTAIPT